MPLDHVHEVVGRNESGPSSGNYRLQGAFSGFEVGFAFDDFSSIALDRLLLDVGGIGRHDDVGGDSCNRGRPSKGSGMVARTVRCHTFFSFTGGKFHDRIGRPSGLECADLLKIFTLKVDATSCNLIDSGRGHHRSAVDKWLDTGMRRSDIGEGRKVHEVKIGEGWKLEVRATKYEKGN